MRSKEEIKAYQKDYRESHKTVAKEYSKKYRQDNKEILNEKKKIYCKNNKELIKLRNKRWSDKNKDKIIKKSAKYYINHRESIIKKSYKYSKNNPEKVSVYKKRYLENNPEKRKESTKKYYKNNRKSISSKRCIEHYGIDGNEKYRMLREQSNCCAIHGGEFKNSKDTCVDHIHNSNPIIVRGLLCYACNTAVGFCRDNTEIIKNFISYISSTYDNGEYKSLYNHKKLKTQMIVEQNNKCFTCNKEFKNSRDSHLDHNHKTMRIRKVLCSGCNTGLGLFKENINVMQEAINYLIKWKN